MKRTRYLSLCTQVLTALFFVACATAAPAPSPAPKPESVAKAPEKVAKQRTIVTKVPVLMKETSFYPDGPKDEYISYKLDEAKKNVLEKSTYDASRADPVERAVSEYKNGLLAAETLYESDGKVRTRREIGYDASGRIASEKVLDSKSKVQSSSAYVYDASGRKTEWRVLDSSGGVKAVTVYSYDKGGLVGVEMRNIAGAATGTIKLENEGGKLVKRSYLAADGSLQKFEAYSYANGRVSTLENRRSDGSLASKTAYEYGPLGELLKSVDSDSSGAVTAYSVYEYVVREDSASETYYE